MDQAQGWMPDPEHEGEERYWSGSRWTDRVRPAGKAVTMRLPEHVPELQRALSEATMDIDAVEDRLSTLFDRKVDSARTTRCVSGDAEDFDLELYLDFEVDESDVTPPHDGSAGLIADARRRECDEGFAELDAALAAERPERLDDASAKRSLFRRRS